MRIATAILMTGLAAANLAHTAELSFADDRMAVVNGQRTFILGLYENPKDDAHLDAAVQAGFNLVHATTDPASLDRLHSHGAFAWVNTGPALDLSVETEAREARLRELVKTLAGHPALLVWEVPDEALWNNWYSATTWRYVQEPKQQNEKINALADSTLREELSALRDKATEALRDGRYREGETLADDIWRKLGTEPPHPDLNYSNAAERAAKMAGGLKAGYTLLRELDPVHPVWMNHAPRNQIAQLAVYNEAADIVGCDIYPVPTYFTGHSDLADRSLASVGAYTDRMQEAAPGKPVWMVLQGFGWKDIDSYDKRLGEIIKRPNLEQTRFMAYDAIVHGARGILYWGTAYIEKDSDLWKDILTLAKEIKGLQHVLSAPDGDQVPTATYAETWGSVDRGLRILPKVVGDQTWYIVVNEWNEPLECTVTGLAGGDGARYRDATTGLSLTVNGGTVQFVLRGNGVLVLQPE